MQTIVTASAIANDLLEMVNWLKEKKCTHVAMESTASYWKPVYNLLEMEDIQILVVNAKHIKNVPGRKTDVKDAEWIAGLLYLKVVTFLRVNIRHSRKCTNFFSFRGNHTSYNIFL
jgi:transposase